jgi:hypothetical protein
VLAIGSELITFTFVAGSPDESGTQVQVGTGTTQNLEFLVLALRGNRTVDRLFDVVNGGLALVCTARIAGPIVVGITNTDPAVLLFTQTAVGDAGTVAANYAAHVQTWVERTWNSGVYEPVPANLGLPDKDLRTRWNLRSDLKPYVGYDWPAYNLSGMVVTRSIQRRYYLAYWEVLGDPPTEQRVYRTAIKKAWFAGSQNKERDLIREVFQLVASAAIQNPFLTYRGRAGKHEVSAGQDSYLGYYRRTAKVADEQIRLSCRVYYEDGTTANTVLWTDTNGSAFEEGDVCVFATGFDRNNLGALSPDRIPYKYEVAVLPAGGGQLSEYHVYHLVDTDANEVFVGYVNSLGVVESMRLIGTWSLGIASDHEEVQRLLTVVNGAARNVEESNATTILRGSQQMLRASTGFMDRGELYAQMDVLLSPTHKWKDPATGRWRQLLLVNAEHVMRRQGDEAEHLYALNLEWKVGDVELAWSDRASMPTLPS